LVGIIRYARKDQPNLKEIEFIKELIAMDDRNANFKNVIRPHGDYYLYYEVKPTDVEGELIEAPSKINVVIVRVELKDKNNANDVDKASEIFKGITINGPDIVDFPQLDLLSEFNDIVVEEANRQIDSMAHSIKLSDFFKDNNYNPDVEMLLPFATWTKYAWGGPVPTHSAYDGIFVDTKGNQLRGENGTYTITTEEPPIKAFWSVTVYDTERGGFLHPNKYDNYHINNTTAYKNVDGTITFLFSQNCGKGD